MPQSLARVYLHLVFSTRGRIAYFDESPLRESLHCYLHGVCKQLECPSVRINGPEDHVHISCCLGRNTCIADLVRDIKMASNRWLRQRDSKFRHFNWQRGYGAFSVSESRLSDLCRYIDRQIEHHERFSFKEEFRKICRAYNIEIDERYVWD